MDFKLKRQSSELRATMSTAFDAIYLKLVRFILGRFCDAIKLSNMAGTLQSLQSQIEKIKVINFNSRMRKRILGNSYAAERGIQAIPI